MQVRFHGVLATDIRRYVSVIKIEHGHHMFSSDEIAKAHYESLKAREMELTRIANFLLPQTLQRENATG